MKIKGFRCQLCDNHVMESETFGPGKSHWEMYSVVPRKGDTPTQLFTDLAKTDRHICRSCINDIYEAWRKTPMVRLRY